MRRSAIFCGTPSSLRVSLTKIFESRVAQIDRAASRGRFRRVSRATPARSEARPSAGSSARPTADSQQQETRACRGERPVSQSNPPVANRGEGLGDRRLHASACAIKLRLVVGLAVALPVEADEVMTVGLLVVDVRRVAERPVAGPPAGLVPLLEAADLIKTRPMNGSFVCFIASAKTPKPSTSRASVKNVAATRRTKSSVLDQFDSPPARFSGKSGPGRAGMSMVVSPATKVAGRLWFQCGLVKCRRMTSDSHPISLKNACVSAKPATSCSVLNASLSLSTIMSRSNVSTAAGSRSVQRHAPVGERRLAVEPGHLAKRHQGGR